VLRKTARKPKTPANAFYLKFCRFLADNGLARRPGETPWHFSQRVAAVQPQWQRDVKEITSLCMDLAFTPNSSESATAKTQHLKQAIRKFRVIN